MGSHGRVTAEGQKKVLASYGIMEDNLDVPIKSSMEIVEIARYKGTVPIYFDKIVFRIDAIIPINRVKIHTNWRGEVESGLLKMLVIGFDTHNGATEIHSLGMDNFHKVIPEVGSIIINKAPVVSGVATLKMLTIKPQKLEFYYQKSFIPKKEKC